MTKPLKSHYLLALQLPQNSLLVLRGHQIAVIVLALGPCPLEALSCKPTNKQLKMLFNSGFLSNVISPTKVDRGQRPILECRNKNGKEAIGIDWQTNNSARASRLFLHFFTVTVRLRCETFCGGRKHNITNFFFFILNFDTVP